MAKKAETAEHLCGVEEIIKSGSGRTLDSECAYHLWGADCDKDDALDWLNGWKKVINYNKAFVDEIVNLDKSGQTPISDDQQLHIENYEALALDFNDIKNSIDNSDDGANFQGVIDQIQEKYNQTLCNLQNLENILITNAGGYQPTNLTGQASKLLEEPEGSSFAWILIKYGLPVVGVMWLASYMLRAEAGGWRRARLGRVRDL